MDETTLFALIDLWAESEKNDGFAAKIVKYDVSSRVRLVRDFCRFLRTEGYEVESFLVGDDREEQKEKLRKVHERSLQQLSDFLEANK